MDNIARFGEPFWVHSTPDTTRPDWHEGDCYMEIEWDFTVQRPKTTCYGDHRVCNAWQGYRRW